MKRDLILDIQRERDKAQERADNNEKPEKQAYHRGRVSGFQSVLLMLNKAGDGDVPFALARARGNDVTCAAELLERTEKRLCDALSFFSEHAPLYRAAESAKLDIADAIALLRGSGYEDDE